jgi:hypothetical protein
MKDLIKKILKEETNGLNKFIDVIDSSFKLSEELKSFLINFIINSESRNIEFYNIPTRNIMGLSLSTGVIINKNILYYRLEEILFVIFHEIAHQYQYKKYGADVMYSLYVGDISVEEAAKTLRNTEEIADDFAHRKIRELQNKKLIKSDYKPPSVYKNVSTQMLETIIKHYRDKLKSQNLKDSEEISKYLYNSIKNEVITF